MLTNSVSGAAKLLYVSQPAVSRLIAYTEQRLGLRLFDRVKGRLYPTPDAKRLLVEVNAVYQTVQRVNDVAEDLIRNRVSHLSIASSSNLGQSVLPLAIRQFSSQCPDVRIVLLTSTPNAMLQSVLTQQVELGIAYLPVSHPNVQSELLYENRIVAALPAGHPLAARERLTVSELAGEPLIGYFGDIPFGDLVRQLFTGIQDEPRPCVEVQQVHVALALVAAGVGVALVDELSLSAGGRPGIVMRPVDPVIAAPVQLFWRMYEPLSHVAQSFVDILKQLDSIACRP